MKKLIGLFLLITSFISLSALAQMPSEAVLAKQIKDMKSKVGLKVGYNIAKITGSTPNFQPDARNGFNASVFYAPPSRGLGYRTEVVFSRQGFSFDQNGKTQDVTQDYIYMPHLTTFTIAKVVQLQAGGQLGYLLNAKKESASGGSGEEQIMNYMNRFDYGAAVGLEVYPFKGLILGGRYNISLGNPYKDPSSLSTGSTTPIPYPLPVNPADFDGKNAVIQFFAGYRF